MPLSHEHHLQFLYLLLVLSEESIFWVLIDLRLVLDILSPVESRVYRLLMQPSPLYSYVYLFSSHSFTDSLIINHTHTHTKYTRAHTHAHTHACKHTRTHEHTHTHSHTHTLTHTHTHTHTHTLTHTHTHTHNTCWHIAVCSGFLHSYYQQDSNMPPSTS